MVRCQHEKYNVTAGTGHVCTLLAVPYCHICCQCCTTDRVYTISQCVPLHIGIRRSEVRGHIVRVSGSVTVNVKETTILTASDHEAI